MTDFGRLAATCGLSDADLAERLNVRQDTIRHWRTGRREPPESVISELENLLDSLPFALPVRK